MNPQFWLNAFLSRFYGCCQCANLECAYTYSSPFLHTISENGHKKCLLKIAIFTNGEFLYIPYGVSETSVLVECIFITFYVCCQCANLHIQCGIQLVPCNNRPSPLSFKKPSLEARHNDVAV